METKRKIIRRKKGGTGFSRSQLVEKEKRSLNKLKIENEIHHALINIIYIYT